jgi:hypothetical protein
VRDPAHHEDHVERPVADDLIRDVDLAAARVVSRRRGESARASGVGRPRPGQRFEPVAAARDGLDELLTAAQHAPQSVDVLREVALVHELPGPDLAQQLLLRDQSAAPPDEHEEHIERLLRERDGHAVSQERALRHIHAERAELVGVGLCHLRTN